MPHLVLVLVMMMAMVMANPTGTMNYCDRLLCYQPSTLNKHHHYDALSTSMMIV